MKPAAPAAGAAGGVTGTAGAIEVIEDFEDGIVEPPLVYQKGGRGPGLKHTRALGEDIWQQSLGVSADAEVIKRELREQDQFMVLASDGLWEFISNQSVVDRVAEFDDPHVACKALLAEAYSLWLQFEVRAWSSQHAHHSQYLYTHAPLVLTLTLLRACVAHTGAY